MGVGVGLYTCTMSRKKFTFAISSPGEFLSFFPFTFANVNSRSHSLYAVAHLSVCLSSLSVTLVHRTQAVEILANISTVFGTVAIR